MSLIFVEGFDQYASKEDLVQGDKWSSILATLNESLVTGRYGGQAWKMNDFNVDLLRDFASGIATVVFGFNFRFDTDTPEGANRLIIDLREGTTSHMRFYFRDDRRFAWDRGDSTNLWVSTNITQELKVSTWYHIQFKVTINNTTGAFKVVVDGVTWTDQTGIDTQNGGTATINNFHLNGMGKGLRYDDLYVMDTAGSVNNDIPNKALRVATLYPNAAGDSAQFTPSAGLNHNAVDDLTHDGDTTYVESSNVGDKDLYNMDALPAGLGDVRGVQVSTMARKDDANPRNLNNTIKSGTTESDGAAKVLTTTYGPYHDIYENDPDTAAAWLTAAVNAMQCGIEVNA
jgi:hypothetical protein